MDTPAATSGDDDTSPLLDRLPNVTFDASKHLNFTSPSHVYTMKDIGLPETTGISPVAVSEAFPLFSERAIQQMRAEVLQKDVWHSHRFSSNLAHCQLRGFASRCAPFTYKAWQDPQVLQLLSQIAGIELVPQMEYEIGHVNFSEPCKATEESSKALPSPSSETASKSPSPAEGDSDTPVVDWHRDSYPFVCVTMLSDSTNMTGGETELRCGDGSRLKICAPRMGHSLILQGRYIEHRAIQPVGGSERITMVTSFRARSPHVPDNTVLTTVRAISDLNELYRQYSEYRLQMLEDRIRARLDDMKVPQKKRKHGSGRRFVVHEMKSWMTEQSEFLAATLAEMVNEDDVVKGWTDGDSHLVSEELRAESKKKRKIVGGC